ncbi:MAG: hypothetical protein ACXVC6_09990 [Bacteroidia bacterium]
MKRISNTLELKEAITELEIKKSETGRALKEEFSRLKESLKPINLAKNAFHEITTSPAVRENVLTGILGLAAGYIAKRALFGSSRNPVKRLAGAVLQMGIAGGASKIKAGGIGLLKRIFKKREKTAA